MRNLELILHATDFSPNSKAALAMACELARRHEAKLALLHVTHPVPCQWPAASPSALYCREHLTAAERGLRNLDCGLLLPERMLRTGEPATVIVRVAKRVRADLIVVGQPRPEKWRWLLEERVAQAVVRKAPCPVLVVAAGATAARLTAGTAGQVVRDPATNAAPLASAKCGTLESH